MVASHVSDAPQPREAAVILTDAQEAAVEEKQMTLREGLRVCPKAIFWSLAMSTCIVMEGYDTFLLGNLYGQPAFRKQFGVLISAATDTYEIPAQWQAGLGNGSSCGQLIGLLLGGYCSERFGFHRTAIGSLAVITCLIFMQFFAPSLPVLLAGIVLFGIPLGMLQTTPIIYAQEVAPAVLRPYLTTYVNMFWAIGKLVGSGVLRGTLAIQGDLSWRITFAIQWLWPAILIPLLCFAPESPWWLVRKGRLADARGVLERLTTNTSRDDASGQSTHKAVAFNLDKQVALMLATTEHERAVLAQTSYAACFKGANLRRTLIVIGIYCVQVLSGNNLRSNSTYFLQQAGLPTSMSFNMTIVNNALALTGGLCTWILIPIWGRRPIYLYSLVMIPPPTNTNMSYSWAIGALLIASSFLYNCSMGTLTNTLCTEIPSTLLRSKSVVLARWCYSVMAIAGGSLTPYQLNKSAWNWGAKTGFFWAGGCLLGAVFAFFFVPETKGRPAAEIDVLFENNVSPRRFSETPVRIAEALDEGDIVKAV
ncbi:general substrate transporter [Microdochium trichocladiopsis]|uniref:General substrate transporter n=1 Tax=Microdochium trichocladiopsis TaxID=1682393 RepID=A0A9P8XRZ7_9PEZI|nr:general substrate transporter [Microdochium trichocladiopsis]KAH7014420.1 general substrate transporter [Microdochium trichocladiopsis]